MFEIAQLLQHKTSKYFQASPATKSNWNVSRVARDGIHMMHLWSLWMPEQWSREQNPKRLRWTELVTHCITNTLWISFESLAFLTFHRFHRKSPSCCDFSQVKSCQVITCAIIVINTLRPFSSIINSNQLNYTWNHRQRAAPHFTRLQYEIFTARTPPWTSAVADG